MQGETKRGPDAAQQQACATLKADTGIDGVQSQVVRYPKWSTVSDGDVWLTFQRDAPSLAVSQQQGRNEPVYLWVVASLTANSSAWGVSGRSTSTAGLPFLLEMRFARSCVRVSEQ